MASYVINEWFWADLRGDNGSEMQSETFSALERFASSNHRMVVAVGSAFNAKAWALCKNPATARIGRLFVKTIWEDSERCLLVLSESLVALPEVMASRVKPDDRYLVQACLTVPLSILVSTDQPLLTAVTSHGIPSLHRNDFLRQILTAGLQ